MSGKHNIFYRFNKKVKSEENDYGKENKMFLELIFTANK